MHQSLEIFRLAGGLARHAGARQSLVAANIAHADSPGYKARDLAPFADALAESGAAHGLRTTRAGHRGGTGGEGAADLQFRIQTDPDSVGTPNGNTVSLETEMIKAAEVRQQHDMALSVYSSALGILRGTLGRGR